GVMIFIDFVTAVCFIGMLCIMFGFAYNLFRKSRTEKLEYLQGFKKGKFFIIYFIAIPLYWIGINYSGKGVGISFLTAIKACVELVVLKFDLASVQQLMADSVFYRIAMDVCFALVIINALILAFSLLGRRVLNGYWRLRNTHGKDKTYVIVGYNQANQSIVKSMGKSKRCIMLIPHKCPEAEAFAYVEKVSYVKTASYKNIDKTLLDLFNNFDDKNVDVIVNTGDDATNLTCTKLIADLIIDKELAKYISNDAIGLNAYVFSDPVNTSFFLHFEQKTGGCVHYVNKYKLLAMDFVDKYPLTQFLDDRHIDYAHGTIKPDVSLNVLMIGFGKTNQQIFLTSVANNQFLTYRDGEVKEKTVNYFIYDKKDARNDKNLNHNYYRFSNELTGDDYLELPPKPANEQFFEYDVNDTKFYTSVKENLTFGKDGPNCNYIIIAFGSDMQNLDLGEKMLTKIKEWGVEDNTKVFVKIRDGGLKRLVVDQEYAKDNAMISFGNEDEVVYSLSQIIDERIERMAFNKHFIYKIQSDMTQEQYDDAMTTAKSSWFSQNQIQRQSNVYACLSIRSKLQLLGFDYCRISEDRGDARDQFMERYQCNNPIVYSSKSQNGRREIIYTTDFVQDSVRGIMAIQEHQRWNAYHITCGFVPSTKTQIMNNQTKDFTERRHGNITTFEGLVEYRKMVVERDGCSEIDADVIKYDYQIMDDLVWMLDNSGYKIYKR
ncbi:MAG: hypothetical protein ACI4MY_02250, partial [Christensenellales bacterium]